MGRNGLFYLNNSGSKWTVLENGEKEKCVFVDESGARPKLRTVEFYSSFGNFAAFNFKVNGKMKSFLCDHRVADFPLDVNFSNLGNWFELMGLDKDMPVIFSSIEAKNKAVSEQSKYEKTCSLQDTVISVIFKS